MLFHLVRNSDPLHNQNDHYHLHNSPLPIHFLEHLKTVQYFPTYFSVICHKIIPRSRPRLQARMHAYSHKDTQTHTDSDTKLNEQNTIFFKEGSRLLER